MSALKRGYESWVQSEQKWFMPLLDAARQMTLFLPGRYAENELRSEAIYVALNLLSAYHDSILGRARTVSCELKYGNDSTTMRFLQNTLIFLHYTEVWLSMATTAYVRHQADSSTSPITKQQQAKLKWLVIALIEGIKSLCRVAMLANNKGRMLLPPTQNEQNLRILDDHHQQTLPLSQQINQSSEIQSGQQLIESSSPVKPAPVPSDLALLYRSRGRGPNHPHGLFSLDQVYVHPHEALSYRPPARAILAELLYILRPFIYAAARLYNRDSSWRPFILSALADVTSRILQPSSRDLSDNQRTELTRRTLLWAFYALRSPFFEHYTQYPLIRASQILNRVPVVGFVFGNVVDLVFALQQHYFYTSAS